MISPCEKKANKKIIIHLDKLFKDIFIEISIFSIEKLQSSCDWYRFFVRIFKKKCLSFCTTFRIFRINYHF